MNSSASARPNPRVTPVMTIFMQSQVAVVVPTATPKWLPTLQTELVQTGFPAGIHHECQFLQRRGLVSFDQNRNVFVDILYLSKQLHQLLLTHFPAVEGKNSGFVDSDSH